MTLGGGIPVCMRCGSGGIRHQSSVDGLWPAGGEGVAWVCDDCGHIGAPFLLDRGPSRGALEPDWAREVADAAFEVDDDAWHGRPYADTPRWTLFGIVLIGLGVLFFAPGVLSLEAAVASGHPWGIVRALVGTGWLTAIGVVLLVVGVRRLRPGAAEPRPAPQ